MFSCENWINILKKYGLPLPLFMCGEHQLCATLLNSCEWNSTVSLLRKQLLLEARGSNTFFSTKNWVNFKEEYAYLSGF
jgi:hypothetical protein